MPMFCLHGKTDAGGCPQCNPTGTMVVGTLPTGAGPRPEFKANPGMRIRVGGTGGNPPISAVQGLVENCEHIGRVSACRTPLPPHTAERDRLIALLNAGMALAEHMLIECPSAPWWAERDRLVAEFRKLKEVEHGA